MSVRITAATLTALATGCATSYATHTRPTGEPLSAEWSSTFRQGASPIDEQDYYRIAGDREAEQLIGHRRDKGITYNRIGLFLAAVGIGALAGGAAFGESRAYAGAILLPIGGVMAFWGKGTAEKRPQLPIRRAQIAGDKYNASIGAVGGDQ